MGHHCSDRAEHITAYCCPRPFRDVLGQPAKPGRTIIRKLGQDNIHAAAEKHVQCLMAVRSAVEHNEVGKPFPDKAGIAYGRGTRFERHYSGWLAWVDTEAAGGYIGRHLPVEELS